MADDDQEALKLKFNRYITKGKQHMLAEQYANALKFFKKAEVLFSSDKLVRKIMKITKFLEEYDEDSDEDGDENLEVVNGFKIHKGCWDKLYPYQKEGVLWFWDLFKNNKGGILGDDMGLGKTIQVIAFLSGMFDQGLIETVLIVVPKSLMENWTNEFENWAPGILLEEFHGAVAKRNKNLRKVQRRNGVILTTYGLVYSSHEQLSNFDGDKFIWDFIILDEGHKIKNQNKTSKSVRSIPAKHHFILTGTPIQNNLSELWSLVDFVTQGKLLGTLKTFKGAFEFPIVRGREKDASNYEMQKGNEMSRTLRKMIAQYFKRRTKEEINKEESSTSDGTQSSERNFDLKLAEKSDLIVWLYLSDKQLQIYQDFLSTAIVREAMMSTKSPLAQLTMLKKIADHPRLLSSAVCETLGLSDEAHTSEEVLVQESSKIQFLLKLVRNLKEENHRVLIFSQSRKMLDIVDKVLTKEGTKLLHFDGRILDPADRQSVIDKFQEDSSITCLLLTTQIGSVGLNLTSADRVVIFDPSWNPGTDAQAVDRAYRIGQNKDVIIYRLVTCGTIEEKIYRKQIFKDSISKQTTGSSKNPLRYFERKQLRDLFILDNPRVSATHRILEELNSEKEHKPGPELKRHLDFLKSLNIFGISYHGLVFSKEAITHVDALYENQIMEEAKRAKGLLAAESNLCDQLSNMSLNNSSIFIPSREDVKRYMPKQARVEKEEADSKSPGRIVIPDSPTTSDQGQRLGAPKYNSAASESLEETSRHFESENEAIDTVQDSLISTPCDAESGPNEAQNTERNGANEITKVDDSYADISMQTGTPRDGVCVSAAVESGSYDDAFTHTRDDSKDEGNLQLEQGHADSGEAYPQREQAFGSWEVEQKDASVDSGGVDKNPVHSENCSPYLGPNEFDDSSAKNEGSYIQMTEPFGDMNPGILTSPVVDVRPRTLLFSKTSDSRFDMESRTDIESVPRSEEERRATSRVRYRESNNASLLSEEDSPTAKIEGSFCSERACVLEDENQSPSAIASDNDGDSSQQHSSICEAYQTSPTAKSAAGLSPQTSFADDHSNSFVGEAVYEVIDATCSPMKDATPSSDISGTKLGRESLSNGLHHQELRSFRELEKCLQKGLVLREDTQQDGSATHRNIRRSATGLMYGLCEDVVEGHESENGVYVDVVDAACSPISTKEIDSEVEDRTKARYSKGLLGQHVSSRPVSGHNIKVEKVGINSSRRSDFLQPSLVDCSTPQDEQSVSVTKHMAVCEQESSFQEVLKPNFGPGAMLGQSRESFHRSGGLVSVSGGSEQYQGSESLFSTLSEEVRLGDQKAWSKLTISSGAISTDSESGPRISHQLSPAPRQNSPISSKLERDSKYYYTREESDDACKFVRSFNLDIQEDVTLILDRKIPITSHYISESDSDRQSNKSDQALTSDDHMEIDVNQSNHYTEIVESGNEADEIVLKQLSAFDHESVSDHLETADRWSDADSISSNEMNMISVLSGDRQSPLCQSQSASSMIVSDSSDSDADSELLQRSRRALRRSIMSFRRKSEPTITTLQCSTTASADGSPEIRGNLEKIGALGGQSPASGDSTDLACEELVTAELAVTMCKSMLIDKFQCSTELLNALLPLFESLENAEYDLETRREVCALGLR